MSLLPPGEREGRLLQVEPRLAAEVRHLLALLPSAERLFADLEQRLEPGRRIGAWRLTALLGRGGMGEVWRAERADGEYQARVAIKFLGNLAIAGGWDRFQREKQFLANLKHPGIAKMIDAGTTAAGVPWLAMELVDGVPITQFAAQVGLRERVQLIIRLCEAIEYAHQKLIVHRDLKPPNILVTSRGNPKLLDFGIALDLDRTESITTPLARMVSIEWASPEQLRDEPVSTATDVFSLGRVLCAVLAGRTGLEDKKGRALWDAVIHSAHPSPSQLSGDRRLEGDLDSIVLRATAAKPEDRYRSVSELRQDLENWIALRPV
ncbi:MAG: serine/threonine protein kinase, partial [Bryobacterales bacterium]|nr:serine/threonine protein kinase [Bryobacterales bacterium]